MIVIWDYFRLSLYSGRTRCTWLQSISSYIINFNRWAGFIMTWNRVVAPWIFGLFRFSIIDRELSTNVFCDLVWILSCDCSSWMNIFFRFSKLTICTVFYDNMMIFLVCCVSVNVTVYLKLNSRDKSSVSR